MIDGITAAQWLDAGSRVIGAALKGGEQAGPSSANGFSEVTTNSWLDSSGWTVATGGSTAKGGDREQASGAAAEVQSMVIPLFVVAGLVALYIWKRA